MIYSQFISLLFIFIFYKKLLDHSGNPSEDLSITTAGMAEGEQMENTYPLTIEDAAAYTHLSKGYLYQLCWYGKISHYKPSGGRIFFKREDLDAFIYRNRRSADFEQGNQPCL